MDEDELVHGLVNSLAFEVEAIPEDNVIKFTSTNGTPLNVKVRVRNKDEPRLVQRGIVSVPKLGKHIASLDQIKLISSDQTILSFNVYMETEFRKQSPPKSRKHGFNFFKLGGCLGASYDEDEGPYLPGPSSKKALRSRTSSKSDSDIHAENMDIAEKLKASLETSNAATRDKKKLFGKCKPGGCLDPPFGEDKESYHPANLQSHMKPKYAVKVEDNKEGQSISTSSAEPGKSSKELTKLLIKELNKDVIEPKPLLDIYARPVSLENSSTSNYSNAAIRHPSKMSSSKMLDAGKKTSRTYDDDSLRQSYQYPETYFVPPKDLLQHKEEERRYSRERSNDRIRPATTRRENEHQTSATPHVFDVPVKKYPENSDARSPTKLSKHKGKDNTERIKQTLTDLTSNEVDNERKLSEDYRKNSKISLGVSLGSQKVEINSGYQETPPHYASYPKKVDDFEVPIASDYVDFSIISQSNRKGSKSKELNQNMPPAKHKELIENKLEEIYLSDKLDGPENKNLPKDMRNKNVLKNEEAIKSVLISEPINATNPEPGSDTNLYFSPTLVSRPDEVKILRSVLSSDIQISLQVDHSHPDLSNTLDDKSTKTSDKIKKADDSPLSSNKPRHQTNLSMAIRLPSMESVSGVDDTNEKNKAMTEACLNDNPRYETRYTNIYPGATKYVDTIQKSPGRDLSEEQLNESLKLKNYKQINGDSNLLLSEADDEKIEDLLRTNETPKKQTKGKTHVQEEKIEESQTTNKLEADSMQSHFKDCKVVEDSTRKTLQDLDLKIMENLKLRNLIGVETRVKTPEERLSDLNSKNTPDNNWKAKKTNTDSITMENISRNSSPSETLDKNEQCRKSKGNDDTVVETFIHDSNKNKEHNTNSPNLKGVSPDNNYENLSSAKTKRAEDIAKVASDDLPKFDKQLKNKYPESNVNDSQGTNIDKALTLDDKKQPITGSRDNNSHLKHQPIDTSIKNLKSNLIQNSSHDSILKSDRESIASSAYSIEFSNDVKPNNLNDEENKKGHANVNLTDNDNVIIKNTSLHDRNKNLSMSTQDRIPSAILQKTPLVITDDSDLRNDDINVIKPFKRNTFTIVASSTSLEKLNEPISPQQTDVADEHLNATKDRKFAPNDQTTIYSEDFVQNDHQKNKAFVVDSKQETISTDPFVNISTHSKTSLESHHLPIEIYSESENKSGIPGLGNEPVLGHQNTHNTEVILHTKYDDKVRIEDYDKSSLPSDTALNNIKIADTGIRKSQEENDNKMYNKEKLTLKNTPVDLTEKLDSEFVNIDLGSNLVNDDLNDKCNNTTVNNNTIQILPLKNIPLDLTEKSDSAFVNIDLGPNLVNDDLNDKYNNTTVNKTIEMTNSSLLDNIKYLPNKKILISNIPVNTEEAEEFLTAKFARDTNDITYVDTVPITSDDKSDTNSAYAAMEYGSRLLEISGSKFDSKLEDLKDTFGDIPQSTVAVKPDEHTFELFAIEKPIDTKDQSPPMVDEDSNITKITDFGSVGSLNKVSYMHPLAPEDNTRYYDENNTNTVIDGDGNLRKISDSVAVGNFIDTHSLALKDDTRYHTKYDGGTEISKYGGLLKISESNSVESFNKNTDKIPIESKDRTEYDSSSKIDDNGDLRKTSEPDLVGIFNEVTNKEPLLAKDDITRDIKQDDTNKGIEYGALRKLSDLDAMGSFSQDNDRKPPMQEDYARYYSEHAPSSKVPIFTDELGYISQSGTKVHLDTIIGNQLKEQSGSVILKQQNGTRTNTYNQNENMPNRANRETTISSPIQNTKSEVLFLNLALQSYVNDNNETVVQTFNPMLEPVRYTDDNITAVQSLIRCGREIRIPVGVQNDLSIKFVSKTQKVLQDVSADQNNSKQIRVNKNLSEHAHHRLEDVDESLAFIYERELIPLHNIIKNLTEEINTLTTQQELLKGKLGGAKRTKSLRLIPVSKRCGCGKM